MSNYWTVLSGQSDGPNIFDMLEEISLVGIGWSDVGDLYGMDINAIRARVEEAYPGSAASVSSSAGMLDAFANQIQRGDIVLTRKPNDRLVLIGRIAGDYVFNANSEHDLLTHTRTVEWLRTDITYSQYSAVFMANGKNPPWGAQTVWNASQHAIEIDQLLAESDGPPSDHAGETEQRLRFGLERELQDALRTNIHQLEDGLVIAEGGVEHQVDAGRIDIVATDAQGRLVVIELKAGTAQPDSVTQLLAYMGTVGNPQNRPVRGILVAHDFASRVRYAARAVPNITLRSYSFRFAFSDIEE